MATLNATFKLKYVQDNYSPLKSIIMTTKEFFKMAFSFRGRMTRIPFWLCFALNVFLTVILVLSYSKYQQTIPLFQSRSAVTIFYLGGLLVLLINRWALVSKRLNDVGYNFATYIGLCVIGGCARFIPFLGIIVSVACLIVLLILLCRPSAEENRVNNTEGSPEKDEESNTVDESHS